MPSCWPGDPSTAAESSPLWRGRLEGRVGVGKRRGEGFYPSDPESDFLPSALLSPPMAVCDDPPDSDFDEPIVVPIEEAFDLHSFRPADVLAVVDAYLDEAILRGFREVRLIHGRGKGVQRAQLRRFLAQDPRVEEFVQAPPERGGWGATLARLRTNERPEDSD